MQYNDVKDLRNKIQNFSKDKQIDIFRICKSKGILFTENKNGIFINLTELTNIQLVELTKFVDYIIEQEKNINEVEDEKNEMSKLFVAE